MRSAHGRWALVPSSKATPKPLHYSLTRTLMGPGPYWLIINMAYYATQESPTHLFTQAAEFQTKKVSCHTPEDVLLQLRQYQGQPPSSISWIDSETPLGDLSSLPHNIPWWSNLLDGTHVDTAVVPNDFDADYWYLPQVQDPE